MNKKIIIIIITIFILLSLSGCIEESPSSEDYSSSSNNLSPIGIISAPEEAYFGETIVFSASDSYDTDGEIISYNWQFGDNKTGEGIRVKHMYKFENNFAINYPLIYSVYLFVVDEVGSTTATQHQIKIYPKKYLFYLSPQKLTSEKPSYTKDKIRGVGLLKLGSPKELTFELDNSILVPKCSWNATIYLEKPFLILANKISIIFFDNNSKEITKKDEKLSLVFWNKKTVQIKGIFDKKEEFKFIKIAINGFSIGKRINIIYGGEKASNIYFNFTSMYN